MRRRPEPLPPGFLPQPAPRYRRMNGRPYVADVVEGVRAFVEGTSLSDEAIAARTGVGATTIHEWIHRRGWRRPPDASLSTRRVEAGRAGLERRVREALERLRTLVDREANRLAAQEGRDDAALTRMVLLAAAARRACARPPRDPLRAAKRRAESHVA